MGDFREHGVMLYLDKTEYLGFIKCQADKGLGRSYAGKLLFIEGQYKLGYLTPTEYEQRFQKYTQGLNSVEPSAEQLAALEQHRKLTSILEGVLKEWDTLPKNVQEYHLKTAAKHKDLPIALRVIEKAKVTQ